MLKITVFRRKARHPSGNLAQKNLSDQPGISLIPDWLYELTFRPLSDCVSSSLINGERR